MTIAEYRAHPFVSNSDLSQLQKDLLPIDQVQDLSKAFKMGNLVDAMLTRPKACDFIFKTVDGCQYSNDEWDIGIESKRAFLNDTVCAELHKYGLFQKAFTKITDIHRIYAQYVQGRKCLYDIWIPVANFGCDIKSTIATNERQFREQIEYLQYHRARYWYMNISGAEKDFIIGISKVNFKVFKIAIKRDDWLYNEGEQIAEDLAFKYYMLKENLNT